jgi:hypothetical protein
VRRSSDAIVARTDLHAEICHYVPGNEEAFKKTVASREWDGVLVGFGVRTNPLFIEIFESIVNIVHQEQPRARLLFSSSATDHLDAIQRNFGLES